MAYMLKFVLIRKETSSTGVTSLRYLLAVEQMAQISCEWRQNRGALIDWNQSN